MADRRQKIIRPGFPGDRRRNYWDRRKHEGPLRWLWTPLEDLPRLLRQWRDR